ncbi:hypothetical protein JXA47_00765 [Candidatus Sumerlaeota bacterium]|nr:hypothetical protein [Candidatus Sumerlaeota bacterium]
MPGLLRSAISLSLLLSAAGLTAAPVLSPDHPLDLAEIPWTFQPRPDTSARLEQALTGEVETMEVTLPGTLQSPTGEGTLSATIRVADVDPDLQPLLSTEITIGDIDGASRVLFNGQPVGEFSGMAIADTGLPRRHVIPSRAIRFGRMNEITIEVQGQGGAPDIRVRGPITLAALGPHEMWEALGGSRQALQALAQGLWGAERQRLASRRSLRARWRDHRRLVERIAEAESLLGQGHLARAHAVIGEVLAGLEDFESRVAGLRFMLAEALGQRARGRVRILTDLLSIDQRERGVELRRHPDGFGRWGLWLHDGTPHLRRVSPTEIRGHGEMGWRIAVDDLHAAEVVDINWLSKTTLVTGERGGDACDYAVSASLPFPGVMLELRAGNEIVFDLDAPFTEIAPIAGIPRILNGELFARPLETSRTLIVRRRAERETIWLIHTGEPLASVSLRPRGARSSRLSLTLRRGASQRLFLMPLHGIDLVDTTGDLTMRDIETIQTLLSVAEHFPVDLEEFFAVDPRAQRVTVFDLFESLPLDPESYLHASETPPVWYPPLAIFSAEEMDQDVEIRWTDRVDLPATSLQGPIAADRDPRGIAVWSMPLPSLDGRYHVRPEGQESLLELLNAHLTDLGTPTMPNAVDRTYKSRVQGYHAWAMLSEANRERLGANSREMIPLTFDPAIWHRWDEPFTGLPTWSTYTIEGPAFDLYDQDWGNGLPLCALSIWAQVEGDWSALREHREALDRMWAWWAVTDDWSWLRCANANHGHGTGAGDCSCAAFAGAIGYARIMDALGDVAGRDEAWLIAARSALSITSRFGYTAWARERGMIPEDHVAIGFHEGEGFLSDSVGSYPWNVTSMISGNGVQPEVHSLLLERVPGLLETYEEEILAAHPDLFDGEFDHGRSTLYRGNSGYITLPHIAAQARLGAPLDRLRENLRTASSNPYLWWLAPTVIAEIAGRDTGFFLTRWSPARLEDAWVESDGSIRLDFAPRRLPLRWEAASERQPSLITVNGRISTDWVWDPESGRLAVEAALPGSRLEFQVGFE